MNHRLMDHDAKSADPADAPDSAAGRRFDVSIPETSAEECLDFVEACVWESRLRGVQVFRAAAFFADLQNGDARDASGRVLPGMETAKRLGGVGTPLVWEFAAAELAGRLRTSPWQARSLMADALDVRHRLPLFWAAVEAGRVEVWLARKVAARTRALTMAAARMVDAALVECADGRLPWSRFEARLDAKVIEADPEAAAAREAKAAAEQFARVGRTTGAGMRLFYLQSTAAAVAQLDATVGQLAGVLEQMGDPDSPDLRRAKAMLILTNPGEAARLLGASNGNSNSQCTGVRQSTHTCDGGHAGCSGGGRAGCSSDGHAGCSGEGRAGCSGDSDAAPAGAADEPLWPQEPDADVIGEADLHPSQNDADDDTNGESNLFSTAVGVVTGLVGSPAAFIRPHPPTGGPPGWPARGAAPPRGSGPWPVGDAPPGTRVACAACHCRCGDAAGSRSEVGKVDIPPSGAAVSPGGAMGMAAEVDWGKVLPRTTLYVHVSSDTFVRDHLGVARFEGEGPVSTFHVRSFLGPGARVTVVPVLDLENQAPVDAYEVPDRLREAVHLRSPADVFPFATNTSRGRDMDHTAPFRPPGDDGPPGEDGRPGQTGLANLGPLARFHHRIKTHAGWVVKQPFSGIFIWRSPHGQYYLVDHTGTRTVNGIDNLGEARRDPRKGTAEDPGIRVQGYQTPDLLIDYDRDRHAG